jgi:hypothetical protein
VPLRSMGIFVKVVYDIHYMYLAKDILHRFKIGAPVKMKANYHFKDTFGIYQAMGSFK